MTTTYNNNLSPLPFYTNIVEQNHRLSYAYGQVYPLYGSTSFLLPFQITRQHSANQIASVEVYAKDGALVTNLTTAMVNAGLSIVRYNTSDYDIDIIVFPASFAMSTNLEEGMYYLKISDGSNTWYSDILTLVNDVTPYLCIEWYDVDDLEFDAGIICYSQQNYRNRLYFSTELGKPEYTFEEEGESRDGYFFAEKQLSSKTYKAQVLAPEYLVDAMRLIRLSDIVKVRDKFGRIYECDTFLITPQWQTQGDLASVEIEFTTSTVVKKIGKGYLIQDDGSFNDDYNDDYDNEET